MTKSNLGSLAIGAVVVLAVMLLIGRPKPRTITVVKTHRDTVKVVVRDTVEVVRVDSVYVTEYVPVVTDSGTAVLDTTFTAVDDDTLRVDAHLSVSFDLIDSVFRDLILGFPLISYPRDSVYFKETITDSVFIELGTTTWEYIKIGTMGAAFGLVVYALAQGI